MHAVRRLATITLLVAVIAAGAGCGVEAGDQATGPGSGATTTTEALSPVEKMMVDRAKDLYVELGMDPDDADCLARGLVDAGAGTGNIDPTDTGAMMDIVNECDIPMSDIAALGSQNGLNSMEDGIKFGLEANLESSGLSKKEAACVADAFVDQYGSDMSAMQDQDKVTALMEGCKVDPSKYGG